ncbi:MAG: VWA domain-containing protein [Candidatus Aminicenantales bacterium]
MIKDRFCAAALGAILLGAPILRASAQDVKPPSSQAVEVRVRVSAEGRFVDDLALKDFNVQEDGKPRSTSSLALVRGGKLVRQEGEKIAPARLERSYTLLFQVVDWDPALAEVVDDLFGSVLKPGDSMTLVTPTKPYNLAKDALTLKSKADLTKGMKDVLRKDILRGGGEYRSLINELKRLTRAISGDTSNFDEDMESDISAESFGLEMQIDRYRQSLMKMDRIRLVDEAKLLAFAGSLKAFPGQKTVMLFYQREYRPEISPATLNSLISLYQGNGDIIGNLMDLFNFYKRETTFNADSVKKAFADAGIDFHFIFMEKKVQRVFGATMREQSEDTYPGFVQIAAATGGTSESSMNPAVAFKHAASSSDNYYILSFTPEGDAPVGGFRHIEVRVNRDGCKISNPLGYYAK